LLGAQQIGFAMRYSDAGCRFAASLGAEPVRNFSPSSAPFALARGKITGSRGPGI